MVKNYTKEIIEVIKLSHMTPFYKLILPHRLRYYRCSIYIERCLRFNINLAHQHAGTNERFIMTSHDFTLEEQKFHVRVIRTNKTVTVLLVT